MDCSCFTLTNEAESVDPIDLGVGHTNMVRGTMFFQL
jgi:hypothetical protein